MITLLATMYYILHIYLPEMKLMCLTKYTLFNTVTLTINVCLQDIKIKQYILIYIIYTSLYLITTTYQTGKFISLQLYNYSDESAT